MRPWATRAGALGPAGSTRIPGLHAIVSEGLRGRPALPCISGPGPMVWGVDKFPGPLRPMSEGPQFRPALLGESRSVLRAHGVDPRSWVTQAKALWLAGSTSCPGRLGPSSKGPRGRPDVTGNSGQCPRALVSNSSPGRLALVSEGPRVIPAVLGHSGRCPTSCVVDQASWATQAHARGPPGWTV